VVLSALAAVLAVQSPVPEPQREEIVELPLAAAPSDAPLERPLSLIVSDDDGRPQVWLLASLRVSLDLALDAYVLAAPDRRAPDLTLGVSLRLSIGRPSIRR
jgi:hypothetical protein